MNVFRIVCSAAVGLLALAGAGRAATPPPPMPDFDELRAVIRAHLIGATDAELNRASVEGLLHSLRGKVRLLAAENPGAASNAPALARLAVVEEAAYLRIHELNASLPAALATGCRALAATNHALTGVILDLRFAEGDDYAAAAAIADLFQAKATPLLDWGTGVVSATEKTNALSGPIAVLVNSETTGAAEALAATLRECGTGLILGTTTRGAAMTAEDFTLKDGRRIRIATATVKVGAGTPLVAPGVKPDIEVAVSPEAEREFLLNPYSTTNPLRTNSPVNAGISTNRPVRRPRVNEADLVRARRDGVPLDVELLNLREGEPERPALRDPALARAVDLLKGLAVVRRARP